MPLVITDVSLFDEAGAQLVRLDAHFQTDYRARRVRRHHVLSSPRMRALKGMWRSVVVGKGRGSAARPFRAQLVQRFGRFSCQDLPWGLYYFRLARHSDSEEQLALPSVRFSCLLPEATPYGYRAAILRMPCNLDASSSIPISSSAW